MMRELSDYLTARELYVLENYPAKNYAQIGRDLGISYERVRQLKVHAERLIRAEKRKELAAIDGQIPITITIAKKDLSLIIRALNWHQSLSIIADSERLRQYCGIDPDISASDELSRRLSRFLQIANDKDSDTANAVQEPV